MKPYQFKNIHEHDFQSKALPAACRKRQEPIANSKAVCQRNAWRHAACAVHLHRSRRSANGSVINCQARLPDFTWSPAPVASNTPAGAEKSGYQAGLGTIPGETIPRLTGNGLKTGKKVPHEKKKPAAAADAHPLPCMPWAAVTRLDSQLRGAILAQSFTQSPRQGHGNPLS